MSRSQPPEQGRANGPRPEIARAIWPGAEHTQAQHRLRINRATRRSSAHGQSPWPRRASARSITVGIPGGSPLIQWQQNLRPPTTAPESAQSCLSRSECGSSRNAYACRPKGMQHSTRPETVNEKEGSDNHVPRPPPRPTRRVVSTSSWAHRAIRSRVLGLSRDIQGNGACKTDEDRMPKCPSRFQIFLRCLLGLCILRIILCMARRPHALGARCRRLRIQILISVLTEARHSQPAAQAHESTSMLVSVSVGACTAFRAPGDITLVAGETMGLGAADADGETGERPSGEWDFLPSRISRSVRAEGLK